MQQINYYPTIKQAFNIFGFLMLMIILFTIVLRLIDDFLFDINNSLVTLLLYSLPIIITTYRYAIKKKISNSDNYTIKINKISNWIYLQIILLSILLIIIIDPITVLIPVPECFRNLMIKTVSKDIYSFITIVLIAPIFEELIFRGIILDGFLKIYSPKKSIIWSSILFAFIHLNPWQAIGAFLIGLFIGWIYYRTQSIIPCILIHFTNNLMAFLIFVLSSNNVLTFSDLVDNKIIFITLIISFSTMFYFGLSLFNKRLNKSIINLEK